MTNVFRNCIASPDYFLAYLLKRMIKVLQLHYSFFLSGYPYDAAAQSAAYQQYVNSQVRT